MLSILCGALIGFSASRRWDRSPGLVGLLGLISSYEKIKRGKKKKKKPSVLNCLREWEYASA